MLGAVNATPRGLLSDNVREGRGLLHLTFPILLSYPLDNFGDSLVGG